MKKAIIFCLFVLVGMAQGAWAQTTVTTEQQLNDAIANNANIVLGGNINITKEVVIGDNKTVTIDLHHRGTVPV